MATAKTEKPGKEYLKRDEYADLFGTDFVEAFDAAREAHKATWAKLTALASEHIKAPDGMVLKLTPGFGDTLGVTFEKPKGASTGSNGTAAKDRLAAIGAAVMVKKGQSLKDAGLPDVPEAFDRRKARKGIGSH